MSQQSVVPIEALPVQKSLLDLSNGSLPTDFGLDDFVLSKLMDDVMLIEFCDLEASESGEEFVKRGSLIVPTSQIHNMWRKGIVILKGPNVRYTNIGDIVVFPANMGIKVTNIEVDGHGKISNGLFLNEQRMFGICKEKK